MLTGIFILAATTICSIILASLLISICYSPESLFAPPNRRSALILVLGDVGRSPRMMYHTESMARLGWDTWLVGYRGQPASFPVCVPRADPVRPLSLRLNPPRFVIITTTRPHNLPPQPTQHHPITSLLPIRTSQDLLSMLHHPLPPPNPPYGNNHGPGQSRVHPIYPMSFLSRN
jgi:hypothetical protein